MTPVSTSLGLATGGGVAGLLVQVTPRPDAYVFPALTLAFVALAALALAIPETIARQAGWLSSLRPRVRVSRETRADFLAAVPAIVAGWSVTGLFLALAPSLVSDVLHVRLGAAGGLSIAVLFLANSAGGLWSARYAARAATFSGGGSPDTGRGRLGDGPGLRLHARLHRRIGRLRAGCRPDVQRNPPWHQRGHQLNVAVGSVLGRLGDQIRGAELPFLAAGLVAPLWGLETTGYLYIAFVGALSVGAAIHAGWRRAHEHRADSTPAVCETTQERNGHASHHRARP
jgi:hypothetical protein